MSVVVDGVLTASEVLGRTCRALRGSHKTDALARAMTEAGLPWTTGRVAHLESGKVSPTVTTLLALAKAFSSMLDRPVTLAELFDGDGRIALGNSTIDLDELRSACSGEPVSPPSGDQLAEAAWAEYRAERNGWPPRLQRVSFARHRAVALTWREGDDRAAATLGLSRARARAEMAELWGRSLTEQRDLIADLSSNQQQRGRITRVLLDQLREAVGSGDDN